MENTNEFSVALTSRTHKELEAHLRREDGQEDLTFLIWRPCTGTRRATAVINEVIWPNEHERHRHGNVSFESSYFLRAAAHAADVGGGLALIHSHPGAKTWQGLSSDDHAAETGHAGQAKSLTGLPLVGLTLGTGNGTYSARRWHRVAAREYAPQWAENVRVAGAQLRISLPGTRTAANPLYQRRTIDSWGEHNQNILGSLRVAVVGAGSVGSQIIESLARTGFGDILIMDFDAVEPHNLDRIMNATTADAEVGILKAEAAARAALAHGTHPNMKVTYTDLSAVEPDGIALLKDCDLIFSCVDRPAGRQSLNMLAYAHLIPVVDGGVMVTPGRNTIKGASWRAHAVAPGRRCMECLEQFDSALVQADRDGLLADATYLAGLPADHVLNRNQNVFAFSAAAAAEQVLTALRMVLAPSGVADIGAQTFHFTTGTTDINIDECEDHCITHDLIALGDSSGRPTGHRHVPAEKARAAREQEVPVVGTVTGKEPPAEPAAGWRQRLLNWARGPFR